MQVFMKPPYFILQLKADLSLDDCIHFLNQVTEEGKRQFRNLYVALPLSRLQEITKAFPDSGITFGVSLLNRCDNEAFSAAVAGTVVKNSHGHFSLVGTKEERQFLNLNDEHFKAKLIQGHKAGLKQIFCISGSTSNELEEQLHLLKDVNWLSNEVHPLIVYELPFTTFANYLPSDEEVQKFFQLASDAVRNIFSEESSKISLLAALPNDLVGFANLIEKLPFAGAFFIKSGIYPHAVHQETVQLFHVHCTENPGELTDKDVTYPQKILNQDEVT